MHYITTPIAYSKISTILFLINTDHLSCSHFCDRINRILCIRSVQQLHALYTILFLSQSVSCKNVVNNRNSMSKQWHTHAPMHTCTDTCTPIWQQATRPKLHFSYTNWKRREWKKQQQQRETMNFGAYVLIKYCISAIKSNFWSRAKMKQLRQSKSTLNTIQFHLLSVKQSVFLFYSFGKSAWGKLWKIKSHIWRKMNRFRCVFLQMITKNHAFFLSSLYPIIFVFNLLIDIMHTEFKTKLNQLNVFSLLHLKTSI